MHEHHACLRVKILAQALPDKELATECQQTAECSSNMRQEAAGHTCRRLFCSAILLGRLAPVGARCSCHQGRSCRLAASGRRS